MSECERKRTSPREVRAWLKANWDPQLGLVEWRNNWPIPAGACRTGRSSGTAAACRCARCRRRRGVRAAGAVGAAETGPRMLAAATMLAHGSDAIKEKFLRRILTGEDTWCQLFSEPGSGSDLAGATTRADSTARSGSSTARRCGTPARTTPTRACCSRAPTGMRRSIRGSPTSSSTCASPACRCCR